MLQFIKKLLQGENHIDLRSQFLLFSLMLTCIFLFLIIFVNVILSGPLTHFNSDVYYFFRSMRLPWLNKFAIVITSFGYYKMLTLVVIVLVVWLALRRYWLAAIHWVIGWLCVLGSVFVFRLLYFSSRPPKLIQAPHSSSFPSGHVTGALVFVFLFVFMFAGNLSKNIRRILYGLATVFCLVIALTRLYLGLHWLTDVIAGFCLGSAILLFVIISYRRYRPVKIPLFAVSLVVLLALAGSNTLFLYHNYQRHLHDYQVNQAVF